MSLEKKFDATSKEILWAFQQAKNYGYPLNTEKEIDHSLLHFLRHGDPVPPGWTPDITNRGGKRKRKTRARKSRKSRRTRRRRY